MPGGHEIGEEIQHVGHANRSIALLVAVLALFLAFAATGAKSTQTTAITEYLNTETLWTLYQEKRVRRALVEAMIDMVKARPIPGSNPTTEAAKSARLEGWRKEIAQFESDPQTGQGRKELEGGARAAEARRKIATAKYHHFEVAAAAFEIGIVLASASIVVGLALLAWIAGGLGILGLGFMGLASFAPEAVHLF